MTNLERFNDVYARRLTELVVAKPDKYAYGPDEAPVVARKMAAAFANGSYNKDGLAVKATCKELGIPYTYAGINGFIRGAA